METDRDRDGERDKDRDTDGVTDGDTEWDRTFPRGIRPRGTTFEFEYLCKLETEFENNLGYDSGIHMVLISEKTEAKKFVLLSL